MKTGGQIKVRPNFKLLLTDTESCNDRTISFNVLLLEVCQKIAAMTDHFEQSAAGMMILLVDLQMLVELVDAVGLNGDLHFGRTGIAFVSGILFDDSCFLFVCHFFHLK